MRLAALASVAVGGSLFLAKGAVWLLTGSSAMLSSAADSALDLMASLVTLMAVRAALRPPDDEHRYGHGKAEALAALVQGTVMLGSASFLVLHAMERIVTPAPVERPLAAYAVSVLAIVLSLALVIFQKHVVKRTGSLAIAADRMHYLGDFLLNSGAMLGVFLATTGGFPAADGLFGAAIAIVIAFSALGIMREAVDMLMDREMGAEIREKIVEIAMGNPHVRGIHDIRTRRSGLGSFVEFHLEVDPWLTLRAASLVAREVEAAVGEALPNAGIAITLDPLGFERPGRTMDEIARPSGRRDG
ncbi:MAG: CDF family cation-efflux transporter FieF [Rhodothalassiaceae bacterium]